MNIIELSKLISEGNVKSYESKRIFSGKIHDTGGNPLFTSEQIAAEDWEVVFKDSTPLTIKNKTVNESIHKYKLEITDYQYVELPEDAEILTVQIQDGQPFLWAKVNLDADKYSQAIRTIGTGHRIKEPTGDYIATYQYDNGRCVFHVFKDLAF